MINNSDLDYKPRSPEEIAYLMGEEILINGVLRKTELYLIDGKQVSKKEFFSS